MVLLILLRSLAVSCVVFLLVLFPVLTHGQTTISTGSIQGTVTDPTGAVVSGAKITISNKATGRNISTISNSSGAYTSGALTPGDYVVRVEAAGFKTPEQAITVQVGVTSGLNVKLQVGQSDQLVEVKGTDVQVNTEQATIQGVLTADQIEKLPINGRNFLDLAQLEPGVQIQDGGDFDPTKTGFSSISFGGRFGRTARIEVDGLDISDETVGTTTQNIPEGAIQEFQLQQSSLDLSTELTSSGSVNVTTKSGTNAFHGEGFYYFRDQTLDADLPGASDNYFQRNQTGGSIGGPIIKNKLFFFLDAEHTKQDLISPVLPEGTFSALTGNFNSPFRETNGIGRLDWQINDRYKFFYRFSYDVTRSTQAYIPNTFQPFANANHSPVHAMGLDFNTGGFTHSIRFGYTKFSNAIQDAVTGSSILNPAPGIELAIGSDPDCLTAGADAFCSGPNFLAPQTTYQSDHQFKYDGSKAFGAHILRYGGGFNHLLGGGTASFLGIAPAVSAQVTDCTGICLTLPGGASNPLNYPANTVQLGNGIGYSSELPSFGLPAGRLGPDNRISLYIGDAWKVKPNFTVTYGLRYVRDTGRTDSDLGPIADLAQFNNIDYSGLQNRVHQPNLNFAPQLGLAWDPSGKGKTVFRAGIGLFYENSIWNNLLYDRPARLPAGLFLSTPTVCTGGNPNAYPGGPSPTFCGQPIGQVSTAIAAYQAQYQAATIAAGPASNPSYIGTALSDGVNISGTDLLAPKYVSPRSVQMNFGLQKEVYKGTVVSIDYLRNVETHTLLGIDTNHVGDARYFNLANAQAAISATNSSFGCGNSVSQAASNCAINNGAKIADYAGNGLDSGYFYSFGGPCTTCAFPGINPKVGANQMLFPIGRSVYNGLQMSLKQNVQNPFKHIKSLDLQASYSLSKFVAPAQDGDFINTATDFQHPLNYLGPNGLDRRHQFSLGGSMDVPYNFRIGFIGHFYSPLATTLYLSPSGNPGGIFQTDLTGDGTGDGSFTANGSNGDVLPGTSIGSFGRKVNGGNINTYITSYNQNYAGQVTPAGQQLLQNGLFTQTQLQQIGAVQQPIPLAPPNEATPGWLRVFDLSLNWDYKFRERFTLSPGVTAFNVFNFANFDGPVNGLSGDLSGTEGAANGTSGQQPSSNRLGLGSGVFSLGSPRVVEFSLKFTF